MTAESDDDILDSLFHGAALTAYVQVAAESQSWPPPAEATRQRAYDLYEQALAQKNRRKSTEPERGEAGLQSDCPEAAVSLPAR